MTRNLNKAILIVLVSLALAVAAVAVAQSAQPLSGAYTQRLPGSEPYYTTGSQPALPPSSPYLPGGMGSPPTPGGPSAPLPSPAPFTPSQSPYVMRDSTWSQYAVKPTPVPGPFITVGSQPGAVQGGQFGTPFR